MKDGEQKYIQTVFLALLLILITMVFLHSPSTGDIGSWFRWINNASTHGIVEGFRINNIDYPPLASVILLFAAKSFHLLGLQSFEAVKISLALFLFLTSFILWIWTRNIAIVAFIHLSLLLSSITNAYIDIYFVPSLILSMWALKEGRLTLSTILFSISILIKWQPIIMAPFFALYVLNLMRGTHWKQFDFRKLLMQVLFPAIVIAILIFSIYGITPILDAFMQALQMDKVRGYLSGQALNLNWIMTHFLHVFDPDRFGSLVDGRAKLINTGNVPLKIIFATKMLFWLSYISTLLLFLKSDKSYKNLILFSLLGYLVYFAFNVGVHENHLFIGAILSILLWIESKEYLLSMIIIVLINSINIFLFYGIGGESGLPFSRVVGGIDMALLLSLFNVCFILYFWVSNILQTRNATMTK